MKLRNTYQLTAQGFALCLLLMLATIGLAQTNSLQPVNEPANQQAASQAEETKGKKKKSGKKTAKKSDEAETAAPAMPASGATGTTAATTPDATAQEAPAPTGKKQKGGGGKKPKGSANANASTAIRAVLDAQVAAWNAGNLEDFMRGYWNSPELTFVSGGRKVMGYNATIERYRRTYQAEGKEMGKLTFSELEITPLGNDAAFVRGVFQLIMSDARELGGRYTLILRLFPDGWKIVHDHTSSN